MPRPPCKPLLVINHLYPFGGAEIQLVHLAKGLAELGHEVTICCIDDSSIDLRPLTDRGVKIVALKASTRLGRIAAIPRLAQLACRVDVVQCTMWDASLWGRVAAILARRPVIVADHAADRSIQVASNGAPRASWIERHNRLLDRFTFATVACASSQRAVLTSEGVDPDKIVHIPNGIPIEELRRLAGNGPSRGELGLPDELPLAMQVGVFRAEKNQRGALESFTQVRKQVPGAQLVFVGEGPTRLAVEQRAEEIGAGGWTHFLGQRDDVPALLSLADLMLLPSLADAMPMTVLEAMALGVPVLATEVGDVRSMLGNAGVCVPLGEPEAFREACVQLLSDAELRARIGRAGPARVRDYDSLAMSRRYEALLEAACAGERAPAAIADPG